MKILPAQPGQAFSAGDRVRVCQKAINYDRLYIGVVGKVLGYDPSNFVVTEIETQSGKRKELFSEGSLEKV